MLSGHDEEFVNPVDEDFHCIICQLPAKEPVLTRCGHRFCNECLEEYIRRYVSMLKRKLNISAWRCVIYILVDLDVHYRNVFQLYLAHCSIT